MRETASDYRERARKCRAEALTWAERANGTYYDQEDALKRARAWRSLAEYAEQKARDEFARQNADSRRSAGDLIARD